MDIQGLMCLAINWELKLEKGITLSYAGKLNVIVRNVTGACRCNFCCGYKAFTKKYTAYINDKVV